MRRVLALALCIGLITAVFVGATVLAGHVQDWSWSTGGTNGYYFATGAGIDYEHPSNYWKAIGHQHGESPLSWNGSVEQMTVQAQQIKKASCISSWQFVRSASATAYNAYDVQAMTAAEVNTVGACDKRRSIATGQAWDRGNYYSRQHSIDT